MRLITLGLLLGVLWVLSACRPLGAKSGEITASDVVESIAQGVEFIKSKQQPSGAWPDRPAYAGGLTPLCTLALLHAGLGPDDPAVKKALDWLRTFQPNSTYAASLQTMVFCAAEPQRDRLLILRNVKFLERRQHILGEKAGMWAISVRGTTDHTDNSMTHLAVLALHEAERVGVRAAPFTFFRTLEYWKRSQNADGSWGWGPGYAGSGSMTCAGIAAITIASGRRNTSAPIGDPEQINCCGEEESTDQSVERALDWLKQHFSVHRNPGLSSWLSYYLYSLERAGRLTAQRYIGDHDWYREAARALVNSQQASGAWPSDLDDEHAGDPLVSTSFCVMFLAKARRPALFTRLKHAPRDDWNRHSRGNLNLVNYTEAAWGRELCNLVLDINQASVEELLEAPVLLISGRESPQFSAAQKHQLRMYLDRGGFIFGQSNCGGEEFDKGFRTLIAELYPEVETALRPIPPEHPIWRAEKRVNPTYAPQLWSVEVACRTAVVYCAQDLSCYWSAGRPGFEDTFVGEAREQIEAALGTAVNILSYATNRELKFKDPGVTPSVDASAELPLRGRFAVAHVLHPGGCEAAPSALRNLLRSVNQLLKFAVVEEPRALRLSEAELFQYPLAWMHGRHRFELTPQERRQLKSYVERGGLLFADAICSSKEFNESFRREMGIVFPDRPLEAIPLTDRLFSENLGGDKIDVLKRFVPSHLASESPKTIEGPPLLEGIRIGDHFGIVFSPFDISCSLEGRSTPECEGFCREDALRIAIHIVLYALHN